MRSASQFSISLTAHRGGAYTVIELSGAVPTSDLVPRIRQIIGSLSFLSGHPVELALPAEGVEGWWFDWWADAVADIPEHHLDHSWRYAR